MPGQFFALFSRMKNINRWALMRNTRSESLSQHSLEVAATAHALALIGNRRLGKHYDADRAALIGMYHDMPEIITGDMPTPVKYYNRKIRDCYGEIERAAQDALLETLPEDLREDYRPLLAPDETTDLWKLVKAADKISALIKCIEEENAGNAEFRTAKASTQAAIDEMAADLPEVRDFCEDFLPAYGNTLDELL